MRIAQMLAQWEDETAAISRARAISEQCEKLVNAANKTLGNAAAPRKDLEAQLTNLTTNWPPIQTDSSDVLQALLNDPNTTEETQQAAKELLEKNATIMANADEAKRRLEERMKAIDEKQSANEKMASDLSAFEAQLNAIEKQGQKEMPSVNETLAVLNEIRQSVDAMPKESNDFATRLKQLKDKLTVRA